MKTYIIIDNLGMQHGIVKANSHDEAKRKYAEGSLFDYMYKTTFAICKDDLDIFKQQINKLS